jgi:hypothetical protein
MAARELEVLQQRALSVMPRSPKLHISIQTVDVHFA